MEKTKKNKNHDSREPNITETQTNFTTPGNQLKLLTYYKRSFQSNRGVSQNNLGAFSVCLCTWRPKVNVSSSMLPPYFLRQSLSGAYQFSYAGQQDPEIMELATMHSFFM